MKFVRHFDRFLADTVNLPKSKLQRLDGSVDAVYRAIRDDQEASVRVLGKIPQGSWAHKTIINPPGKQEFDADVLLELEERSDWDGNPRAYRNAVGEALDRHPIYGEMPRERKCRCVRLVYRGDFHVDVVPFVRRAGGEFIVNADRNEWESTNPVGFTEWFNGKNTATGGNLRRVLRILKYVRDGSDWTGTRSVLLTILVGERIEEWRETLEPGYYGDVPTTLLHIVEDLDAWLQARPVKPPMPDPSNPGMDFDHRWDDATYLRLRDRMNGYAFSVRAAFDEPENDASLRLWQGVLGDRFTAPLTGAAASGPFGAVEPTPGRTGRAG